VFHSLTGAEVNDSVLSFCFGDGKGGYASSWEEGGDDWFLNFVQFSMDDGEISYIGVVIEKQ
jgi:hypothetical protein